MRWKEVKIKYGPKTARLMRKYLDGTTITVDESGNVDYPESDIRRAYRELKGENISEFEWD